jgi:hypothetical protein
MSSRPSTLPVPVAANRPVYTWCPETEGRYETWYLKVTGLGPERDGALWARYTLEDRAGETGAWCEGTWFHGGEAPVTGHHRVALPRLDPKKPGFEVALDSGRVLGWDEADGVLRARGSVEAGAVPLAWDLEWEPGDGLYRYLSWTHLAEVLSPSGGCTPCLDARMSGWVEVAGERIELDGHPGMQGHLWGTGRPHGWAWCHGNDWEDARTSRPVDAAFEALHVWPNRFAPGLTTMVLDLEGERRVYNAPCDLLPHRRWLVGRNRTGNRAVALQASVDVERLGAPALRAHFELEPGGVDTGILVDPDGSRLRCRNATLARATLHLGEGPTSRTLRARTATLELVERLR